MAKNHVERVFNLQNAEHDERIDGGSDDLRMICKENASSLVEL